MDLVCDLDGETRNAYRILAGDTVKKIRLEDQDRDRGIT
jgi:hypothetical protein